MVAVIDEEGYEGMSVAAVAARAGVSRSALYEYFSGGQECFLATFEALMNEGLAAVARAYAQGDGFWKTRLQQALDELFAILVAQPAAARLCFLEAYAVGGVGADLRDRGGDMLQGLVRQAFDESPERADMPDDVIQALTGGIRTMVQARLRRRQEHELPALAPELIRWLAIYERPTPPLRKVRARPRTEPGFIATSHRDRLFVALAKAVATKGYADTIVVDVVSTAGVSLSTFYENFEGKEAALLEACDFGIEQAFAAVRYAWEREAANGWPLQVNAGMRELLTFLSSEPEWSAMAMVEIVAAGPRARARRDRTIELFTGLVEPGMELEPSVSPTMVEALGGAVYALMYHQIRTRGAERLPEILPAAVFVLLAPFVGNEAAVAVANRAV
jgi:AcrR family transcriptional regulator